ncbi:unnamed protein product [Cochlearia groenlandica]
MNVSRATRYVELNEARVELNEALREPRRRRDASSGNQTAQTYRRRRHRGREDCELANVCFGGHQAAELSHWIRRSGSVANAHSSGHQATEPSRWRRRNERAGNAHSIGQQSAEPSRQRKHKYIVADAHSSGH